MGQRQAAVRPKVYRPVDDWLFVTTPRHLGYLNSLLKSRLGCRSEIWHTPWNTETASIRVARSHFDGVVDIAARVFGSVDVIIEGRAGDRCDRRCVEAVGTECVCSCAGSNHGGLQRDNWTPVGENDPDQHRDRPFRLHCDA